ncbi:MAG TPA: alpha/beta hydrolase [Gemmatimonadales bacterium]|nr:alpha/beta hydrolase [Gemmatimonadales bacterium]
MIASNLTTGERPVRIPAGRLVLQGTLAWPEHPSGLVLFAHGSGSGRFSTRNQWVARRLRASGVATLLFDLLSEEESADRARVFDIRLLADRLLTATEWTARQPEVKGRPVGYFGASTGAAAALTAAAQPVVPIQAVVSRGGRPDLAGEALPRVTAPTLLIVGSRDVTVLELNRQALHRLTCEKRLVVVPGATHLFEEPGTLEEVGQWAAEWFVHHLAMEPTWHRAER